MDTVPNINFMIKTKLCNLLVLCVSLCTVTRCSDESLPRRSVPIFRVPGARGPVTKLPHPTHRIPPMTRSNRGLVVVFRWKSALNPTNTWPCRGCVLLVQPRGCHWGCRGCLNTLAAAFKCTRVIIVCPQHSVFKFVLRVEGDVGRLDVHEGDRGRTSTALVLILLAEDLNTLNSAEPVTRKRKQIFENIPTSDQKLRLRNAPTQDLGLFINDVTQI